MKILNVLTTIKYEYLITGFVMAFLYIIWSSVIKPRIQNKEVKKVLEEIVIKSNYKVLKTNKSKYDFVLESIGDSKYKRILIRVVAVPNISTITINSRNTWNLHYGGTTKPGKGYPYNRFLNEISPFLNMNVEDNELKLVLVYKETLKIQKYLNESEIEIVKNTDKVYDYKVLSFKELPKHFQDL